MGVQALVSWVVANKLVAALAAGAVVAAGGSAAALTALDAGPPSVAVDPLEAEPVPDDASEKAVTLAEDEPGKRDKPPALVPTDEDVATEAVEDAPAKPPAPKDEGPATATEAAVDIVVDVSGTASRAVARVHNRGDATSGRVKVKYEGHTGASGTVRVLDSAGNGAECGSWYCWFDALAPGDSVATVVFEVVDVTCSKAAGGGKVIAHYDGQDRDWANNYGWVDWCTGTRPTGGADLAVQVSGTADEFVVRVDNAGPGVAARAKVKMHGMHGAEGTVTVLGTSGPAVGCDGWYCYFEGLPVGQGVAVVRFSVDVKHCWSADGGAKVEVLSDTDANDGNDRRGVAWCDGYEVSPKGAADLAVTIDGSAASYKLRVTNTGMAAATGVVLQHLVKDGEATLELLESSHPARCDVGGCELAELAAGASAWLRLESVVDCAAHPGAFAKGHVTSTSADADGGDDWATLALC